MGSPDDTGASLRDRDGRPSARAMLRCLGYSATIACAAALACCDDKVAGDCDNLRTGEHTKLVGQNRDWWFLQDAQGRSFTVSPTSGDWRCREGGAK